MFRATTLTLPDPAQAVGEPPLRPSRTSRMAAQSPMAPNARIALDAGTRVDLIPLRSSTKVWMATFRRLPNYVLRNWITSPPLSPDLVLRHLPRRALFGRRPQCSLKKRRVRAARCSGSTPAEIWGQTFSGRSALFGSMFRDGRGSRGRGVDLRRNLGAGGTAAGERRTSASTQDLSAHIRKPPPKRSMTQLRILSGVLDAPHVWGVLLHPGNARKLGWPPRRSPSWSCRFSPPTILLFRDRSLSLARLALP